MKNKTLLKIIFLSVVLSSCGLIGGSESSDQPTDSNDASLNEESVAESPPSEVDMNDDLFSKTMEETSGSDLSFSDNPSNIATDDSELMSLQEEIAPSAIEKPEVEIAVTPNVPAPTQEVPFLVEEALPEIKTEVQPAAYSESGQIKNYKVQRGETLMQIAFKLYGDTSKWKEIKNMNSDRISNNTSLQTNTQLKYRAPDSPFVWNPSGKPYIIKSGETLGTISSSVYSTPTKWKDIWENNKPLIKNPNVIYAGFTVYYKNGGMANFVQPKEAQPKKDIFAREFARVAAKKEGIVEEVLVDEAIIRKNTHSAESSLKPKTIIEPQVLLSNDENQVDETTQTLSSTKRQQITNAVLKSKILPKEVEIDLVNNISVPYDQEIEPDIDEEYQTL